MEKVNYRILPVFLNSAAAPLQGFPVNGDLKEDQMLIDKLK